MSNVIQISSRQKDPFARPAWHEVAISLQVTGMILLVLSIIRLSGSADSLAILGMIGPEGAFLAAVLCGFAIRKTGGLMRNLTLLFALTGAAGIVYQSLLPASVLDWVMLSAFAVAVLLLATELLVARLAGVRGVWLVLLFNTFALTWLYFDRMIFSVGRSHLSINHLVQLMHVAEEVKAALFFLGKGHFAVIFELLLFVVAPVPAARMLMAGAVMVPKTFKNSLVVLLVSIVVLVVNIARFDMVCSQLSVYEYLPLRLDLGMLPVPDHPALRKSTELTGLLQQQIKIDEKKLFPVNDLVVGPAFKPVNLVMISVESLRRREFDSLMPESRAYAERGLWLSNHFSVTNITFSSFHSIFRSSFPFNLVYTGNWQSEIPFQRLLDNASYSSLLIAPERINMPLSNFWGTREIRVKAEPKWKNTPLVLDSLLEELRRPGFKAVHAYLYNLHYNYYYPPEAASFAPVIDENINLFLMQPDGENLAGLTNRYANAALHTDKVLAGFLKQAEADGRFADTLFVIFGDHGESLGESGFIAHATGPHIKQFEAPAFFIGAGVVPQKITGPTTHADLLPIICDLMGIKVNNTFGSGLAEEKIYPVLHLDEAVNGRIIVRHRDYMSIFDLADRGSLKWLATVSNEFAIDASVADLYTSENFARLASVIKADADFIKTRIGADGN